MEEVKIAFLGSYALIELYRKVNTIFATIYSNENI